MPLIRPAPTTQPPEPSVVDDTHCPPSVLTEMFTPPPFPVNVFPVIWLPLVMNFLQRSTYTPDENAVKVLPEMTLPPFETVMPAGLDAPVRPVASNEFPVTVWPPIWTPVEPASDTA